MRLISDAIVIVVHPLFISDTETLTLETNDKKRLIYRNQTSLRHILRNELTQCLLHAIN